MVNLFAERLKAARKMAGLSLQQLANQLPSLNSKQALNKYEKGQSYPNSQVLIQLAQALKVPVDFFFMEPEVNVELAGVEFRKRSRLGKTAEAAILARCTDALGRYLELEQLMRAEKQPAAFDFPHLIHGLAEAEQAAEALRAQWQLGQDPIPSVMVMLEEHGYKVIEVEAPAAFDGLKAQFNGQRLIVVNQAFDACRRRFTALHELAHHLLVFPPDMPEQEMERLCHTFAGGVLLPASQVRAAMHPQRFHFYLQEMVILKAYWGISIAAMFARAKTLGIIDDYTYAKLNRGYRSKGYHRDEPGAYRGEEPPHRFRQLLLRGIAEEIISFNQAATLTNQSVGQLRESLEAMG
jgi:Zn-dependent peptidase ImmA (M78 family)/DNA-binding XRE family transcriptional regulator